MRPPCLARIGRCAPAPMLIPGAPSSPVSVLPKVEVLTALMLLLARKTLVLVGLFAMRMTMLVIACEHWAWLRKAAPATASMLVRI